jgi:hypothetical protein
MKVERTTISRAQLAPARQPLQVALAAGRALHALEHVGVRVLERHVQVGQHAAGGHQRQHLVDVRVRVDVVQPHPGAEGLGQLGQLSHRSSIRVFTGRPSKKPVRYLTSTP